MHAHSRSVCAQLCEKRAGLTRRCEVPKIAPRAHAGATCVAQALAEPLSPRVHRAAAQPQDKDGWWWLSRARPKREPTAPRVRVRGRALPALLARPIGSGARSAGRIPAGPRYSPLAASVEGVLWAGGALPSVLRAVRRAICIGGRAARRECGGERPLPAAPGLAWAMLHCLNRPPQILVTSSKPRLISAGEW